MSLLILSEKQVSKQSGIGTSRFSQLLSSHGASLRENKRKATMEDSAFCDNIHELLQEVEKHHALREGPKDVKIQSPEQENGVCDGSKHSCSEGAGSETSVSNMTSGEALQSSISLDPEPLFAMQEQLRKIAAATQRDDWLVCRYFEPLETEASECTGQGKALHHQTSYTHFSRAFANEKEAMSSTDTKYPKNADTTDAKNSLSGAHQPGLSESSSAKPPRFISPSALRLLIAQANPVAVEATYPLPWYMSFAARTAHDGTSRRSMEDPRIGRLVQQYDLAFGATRFTKDTIVVPNFQNTESLVSQAGNNSLGRAKEPSSAPDTFPEKLYRLLTDVEAAGKEHIISFMPSGKSVKIHDHKAFVKEIAPYYFKHKRIASLKRQLNKYGFEMIYEGPEEGAYRHKYFVEGRQDILNRVRRIR